MIGDTELLRRYFEDRSEAAFAELVRLHLNLVYFAALRQVGGDTHRAQEVAQVVFTDLARKAPALTDRGTLAGWLHTSTRFAAAKMRRADLSRQQYEQEATTMNALLSDSEPAADWERLRPLIDEVIHELDDRDREAVLLRYFENRPFAEIGAALRLSEDAARMRVDRALEKLRGALARRGMTSTSAALAVVFASQVAATAPAGLATAIAGAALAGTAGGVVSAGMGLFMSKTTTIVASTLAILALGLMFHQSRRAVRAEGELALAAAKRDDFGMQLRAEQQRSATAREELATLRREVDVLKAKQATTAVAGPLPAMPTARLMVEQQKMILTNLRKIEAAADVFAQKNGRLPVSLDEIVGPTKYVRDLKIVDGEDYGDVSLVPWFPMVVTTGSGMSIVSDGGGPNTTRPEPSPALLRAVELARKIEPAYRKALQSYQAGRGNVVPDNNALVPYFATPEEGADFVEFIEARKAANSQR